MTSTPRWAILKDTTNANALHEAFLVLSHIPLHLPRDVRHPFQFLQHKSASPIARDLIDQWISINLDRICVDYALARLETAKDILSNYGVIRLQQTQTTGWLQIWKNKAVVWIALEDIQDGIAFSTTGFGAASAEMRNDRTKVDMKKGDALLFDGSDPMWFTGTGQELLIMMVLNLKKVV